MIERLANCRTFFVLLAIDLAFTILFNVYGRHYPDPAFDGRVSGFRPSEVEPILRSFSQCRQLDRYLAQVTQLDLIFPLVYSSLAAVLIVILKPRPRWLAALPFAAAFFDYCENFSYIALVLRYRSGETIPHPLAVFASIVQRLKWGFVFIGIAAIVVAVYVWVARRRGTG